MHIRIFYDDVAKHVIIVLPDVFVMIAGYINDLATVSGFTQDFLNHRIMISGLIHFF